MENDILDSLEDLGYTGKLVGENALQQAVNSPVLTCDFMQLVQWITAELAEMAGLEERVYSVNNAEDTDAFQMELSGFLRECNCPYSCLTEGPVDQRLVSINNRLLAVNYLITELQAARIVTVKCPETLSHSKKLHINSAPVSREDEAAELLKQIVMTLGIPKPPDNITVEVFFEKLTGKINELLTSDSVKHCLGNPLLKSVLLDSDWETIMLISQTLQQDYGYRQQMIIQRLGVTVQSFTWSHRVAHKENLIASVYHPIRQRMQSLVQTDIAHLLAAREDLLHIETTSSGAARQRTACDINRVVMGNVPDRGGRAYEHGPPPPEMPNFQQRRGGPGHQGRGGDRGGKRGGRGGGRHR